MAFPTAAVGDPVTYVNNAGVTVPALAASADGGSGVISLFVDDPAGAYFIHVVPKDLTGLQANSWNWPTGTGGSTTATALTVTTGVITSEVANGASAVAFTLDSDNALSTAGAKLLSVTNNSVEKASIDKDGAIRADAYNFALGAFQVATSGNDLTLNMPTIGGALIRSSQSGAHFAYINASGVEVDVIGQGFILKSPDGTRYKIVVADGGALSATPA